MTNLEIDNAYVGTDQVEKIYLGSELVWGGGGEEPDIVVKLTFDISSHDPQMIYRNTDAPVYSVILFDGMEETDITSDIYYYDFDLSEIGYYYNFPSTGYYEVYVYLKNLDGYPVPAEMQFQQIVNNMESDNILRTIELSGNVTYIGNLAFGDNQMAKYDDQTGEITDCGPTEIILPEGLDNIADQAFCHGYYSAITIPSTVTYIGGEAFNVKQEQDELGEEAFDLTVTVEAETPPYINSWGEYKEFGDPCRLTIEVPQGYESDYEADTEWNNYMTGAYCDPGE